MSHTPGPWRAVYDGSSVWSVGPTDDPQSERIAKVERRGTWEEANSNAQLLAAGPDLLAALKDCCAALGGVKVNPDSIPASVLDAIAKAEGR
jgi:hypothetical protein